jgi:hypothetical protein
MGALEECNYAHAPIAQPSKVNHRDLPSLQDGWSLPTHKNFKKLLQTQTGNSQSETKCANMLEALPTYNQVNYVQLPKDIQWCSPKVWGPNIYYFNSPPYWTLWYVSFKNPLTCSICEHLNLFIPIILMCKLSIVTITCFIICSW